MYSICEFIENAKTRLISIAAHTRILKPLMRIERIFPSIIFQIASFKLSQRVMIWLLCYDIWKMCECNLYEAYGSAEKRHNNAVYEKNSKCWFPIIPMETCIKRLRLKSKFNKHLNFLQTPSSSCDFELYLFLRPLLLLWIPVVSLCHFDQIQKRIMILSDYYLKGRRCPHFISPTK